jgi:hypothetical protein
MYAEQASKVPYPTATQVRDTPRLMQQCEQMSKVLACINEQAVRLGQAADRLVNPRPQAVEKHGGPDTPAPHTVEQHYMMLIGAAERLNVRLSEIASQFESAV